MYGFWTGSFGSVTRASNGGQPTQLRALAGDLARPGVVEVGREAREAEPVARAHVRGLPELLTRCPGAVAPLLDAGLDVEPAVERRGLAPTCCRGCVARGVRRRRVDEVRRRAEVVELHEAVGVGDAVAAAERVVEVVDGDVLVGLLVDRDVEALEPRLRRVGRRVGPAHVLEDEGADLAEREAVLAGRVSAQRDVDGAGVGRQRDVLAPHLVVGRADGDQVAAVGQAHRGAVLIAEGDDRAVALGRRDPGALHRIRVVPEVRVVDVHEERELRQHGIRRQVVGDDRDRGGRRRRLRDGLASPARPERRQGEESEQQKKGPPTRGPIRLHRKSFRRGLPLPHRPSSRVGTPAMWPTDARVHGPPRPVPFRAPPSPLGRACRNVPPSPGPAFRRTTDSAELEGRELSTTTGEKSRFVTGPSCDRHEAFT